MGDHLGLNYITTVEDLAVLKRVIVLNVADSGTAVLNAADPAVVRMADMCPGAITYFALDKNLPVMATHLAHGKRAVYVEDGHVVAQEGNQQVRMPLKDIPVTGAGAIGFQVENVLACVAAAWAVGTPWQAIAQGVNTFVSDASSAPGRFNTFDYKGATLIADYGHNPDAIAALSSAVESMPAHKRSVVISGAGDRRDEDITQQTQILGRVFDDVILYEDACQRGRSEGEVMALLRKGLDGATKTTHIQEIKGEFIAIDTALARLNPGDLCLILVDQVQEALAHIAQRVAEAKS
jgi:cyanophycin synthetase